MTPSQPPQMTSSAPVHVPVKPNRAVRPVPRLVAVQVSVTGSWRPPLPSTETGPWPPHTIIRVPVQTAVGDMRSVGTFVRLVAPVQEFAPGSKIAPEVSGETELLPPQMIIRVPVHTATCSPRPTGTFAPVLVATHEFATGS